MTECIYNKLLLNGFGAGHWQLACGN